MEQKVEIASVHVRCKILTSNKAFGEWACLAPKKHNGAITVSIINPSAGPNEQHNGTPDGEY